MTNSNQYQNELAQDRFALLVAARLSDAVDTLPYDVCERLRAARTQALGATRSRVARTARSVAMSGGAATLTSGEERLHGWGRVAALVPLLTLVLGLIIINIVQNDNRANELAEIDSALLTDALPPTAYTDPGFLQFLKLSSGQSQ